MIENQEKKVFITGATGLLGRSLVASLEENGYSIVALVRPGSRHRISQTPGYEKIEWIEGDLGDLTALESGISKANWVLHAGALVSFDPRDKKKLHRINAGGTENLVNTCLKFPQIKKLVHISSISTFSPSKPQPTEIDERQGFNPDENTSDYALSKYRAELEVIRGVEEGLKSVIINPSIILAPGAPNESSAGLVNYVQKGNPFYSTGWINYVDARDVAKIAVYLLENGPSDGTRLIANAGHLPYKDFLHEIARQLGKRGPFLEAGPFLSWLAWRLDAIKSLLTGSSRFLTRFTAAAARRKVACKGTLIMNYMPEFQYKDKMDSISWMCSFKK